MKSPRELQFPKPDWSDWLARSSLRRHSCIFLLLGGFVGVAYSNAFRSGFVLDNEFIIRDDPRLRAVTWENVKLVFSEDYWYPQGVGGLFRPIATLTFLFDYSICGYGADPTHYHWLNLILHCFNAFLVYLLVSHLTARLRMGLAASLLFAAHPIATESVTNLVGRSDLLAAAAVLASLLLYIRSITAVGYRRWLWLAMMGVVVALGVFSKENAIVIVAILPFYDWVVRFRGESMVFGKCVSMLGSCFIRSYVVLIPVVAVFFLVRWWLFRQNGPSMMAWCDNPLRATDFVSARLTAFKVIGYYLWLLMVPIKLSCDYAFDAVPNSSWRTATVEDLKAWGSLGLILLLSWFFWRRYRSGERGEAFFFGWFLIALLPTSNLLVLIDSNMAERFLYLPSVGFIGCLSLFVDAWINRSGLWRWAVWWWVPVVILMGVRSYLRNDDWRSNVSLWTSAVEVCPDSYRAQRSLASALYLSDIEQPDWETIIPIAERAAEIARRLPIAQGDEKTHLALGMYYGLKGDALSTRDAEGQPVLTETSRRLFEQSLVELERAQAIGEAASATQTRNWMAVGGGKKPIGVIGPKPVYDNLWVTYSRLGNHAGAAAILRKIQSLNPQTAEVYRSLPDQLALSGQIREAGIVLIQSLLIELNHELTWQQLALVYEGSDPNLPPPILRQGESFQLNAAHPMIREDLHAAFLRLVELFLRDGQFASAERLRASAEQMGVDPVPLNQLFQQMSR